MKPMATRNTDQLETPLETALAAIGLLMLIGGIWLALLLIDAAQEPEARCFSTAAAEMNYCREQMTWE